MNEERTYFFHYHALAAWPVSILVGGSTLFVAVGQSFSQRGFSTYPSCPFCLSIPSHGLQICFQYTLLCLEIFDLGQEVPNSCVVVPQKKLAMFFVVECIRPYQEP